MAEKTCSKCGLPLGFRKNKKGRWEPCNPDGSDHWDLCREVRMKRVAELPEYEVKEDGKIVTYRGRGKDKIKMGWRYA